MFENIYLEQLTLTNVLLASVAFIASYYWFRRPKDSPPGPRGVPFLGVIPWMGQLPERKFQKWVETYGPIMQVKIGMSNTLVLNDLESVQQAYVKNKDSFSGRPENATIHLLNQGNGIVLRDYGSEYISQRKFGLMTLRGFGVGKRSMEERVQEEVQYLCQVMQSYEGKPFDVLSILTKAVSNNICSVIFGKRYSYSDPEFNKMIHHIGRRFVDQGVNEAFRQLAALPYLIKLPYYRNIAEGLRKDIAIVIDMVQHIIGEHRETFDNDNQRDFIDAFISKINEGTDKCFNDPQLIGYVRELFAAGTETTTSTLRWAILVFLHYPETQKKLFAEINQTIGKAPVAMSHKQDLPYTSAFIEELYRFRTLAPLSGPHKTTQDTTLAGYRIAKNTTVLANLWAIHNNSKVFENPETFKAERHLNESGQFVKSHHVIPFSVGPRHCLGEQLARMEVFIFLVSLVQKFEFKPDPADLGRLPDIMDGHHGGVFVPFRFLSVAEER